MRRKTAVIQVRVDEELGELLRADAGRQRLSVSSWARAILALHYAGQLEQRDIERDLAEIRGEKDSQTG